MRLNIGTRLFLIVALVSVAILVFNAALTRWSFQRDFLAYVEENEAARMTRVVASLSDIYAADGNWERFRDNPRRWHDVLRNASGNGGRPAGPPPREPTSERRPRGGPPPPPGAGGRPPGDPLLVGQRYALADAGGAHVAGNARSVRNGRQVPILVAGDTVGTLHVAPLPGPVDPVDQSFDRQQLRSMYASLAIAIVISALLSALFARQLTRPIRALTAGAKTIASGDYATRIETDRQDELGALANNFNQLAETLERSRASRQQWIADIAHELRTPLSILRGELDALEDGVRAFNADARRSLQAEIERLSALVNDLHELSASDEGRLTVQPLDLDVVELLSHTLDQHGARIRTAGLELTTSFPTAPVILQADATRLAQLFANLIENSLRYTDAPGRLHVACRHVNSAAIIEFSDSAPGVPEHALDRLFDRLYRVDPSRSRDSGGSGLGLAICHAIVAAHEGRIDARRSAFGGITISIELPEDPS